MPHLTPEQVREIERRAATGESGRQIAAATGLHETTVFNRVSAWRKRPGNAFCRKGRPGNRALAIEVEQEIDRLIGEGETNLGIARRVGVNDKTVARRRAEYRIRQGADPRELKRMSNEQTDAAIQLLRGGAKVPDVALATGFSESAIYNLIARYCRKHGPQDFPGLGPKDVLGKSVKARVLELAEQGVGIRHVATELGVSYDATYRFLAKLKAEFRDRGLKCRCGLNWMHVSGCLTVTPEERAERARLRAELSAARRKERRAIATARRARLAANRARESQTISAGQAAAQRDRLFAEISRRVPRHIPPDLRDDIISEAYLNILESARA